MSRDNYPLNALSEALAKAVSLAGQSTVMVNARRRIPASGVAYKTNLIITADHAIERDADISIGTQNTDEHTATVLGRDPSSDLALLELEHNELMPGNFVLEPALVGQLSLALGRPSLNGIQASLGIVSAVGGLTRTRRGGLLEGYLRTDAIPYPGFSGGPLIDATGRILGVNTSGLTPGASITIPALLVRKVAAALELHRLHLGQHGYLVLRRLVIPRNRGR